MRRLYFIVNPISGSGRGDALRAGEAPAWMRAARTTASRAQYAGHAIPLAREALAAETASSPRRTARCAGGKRRAGEPGTELGILPFGTQRLARGLPGTLIGSSSRCSRRRSSWTRATRTGILHNVAGFGFDVDVVPHRNIQKRLNGMLPYLLGILRACASRARGARRNRRWGSFELGTLFSAATRSCGRHTRPRKRGRTGCPDAKSGSVSPHPRCGCCPPTPGVGTWRIENLTFKAKSCGA